MVGFVCLTQVVSAMSTDLSSAIPDESGIIFVWCFSHPALHVPTQATRRWKTGLTPTLSVGELGFQWSVLDPSDNSLVIEFFDVTLCVVKVKTLIRCDPATIATASVHGWELLVFQVGHVSFPVWGGVSRLPHTSSIGHVHRFVQCNSGRIRNYFWLVESVLDDGEPSKNCNAGSHLIECAVELIGADDTVEAFGGGVLHQARKGHAGDTGIACLGDSLADVFFKLCHVSFPVWGGWFRLPHTSSIGHVHRFVQCNSERIRNYFLRPK